MTEKSKAFPASSKTRVPFALMLACLAGTADSIGFLEFAQLFMSFMSGNTTRFGVSVIGGDAQSRLPAFVGFTPRRPARRASA